MSNNSSSGGSEDELDMPPIPPVRPNKAIIDQGHFFTKNKNLADQLLQTLHWQFHHDYFGFNIGDLDDSICTDPYFGNKLAMFISLITIKRINIEECSDIEIEILFKTFASILVNIDLQNKKKEKERQEIYDIIKLFYKVIRLQDQGEEFFEKIRLNHDDIDPTISNYLINILDDFNRKNTSDGDKTRRTAYLESLSLTMSVLINSFKEKMPIPLIDRVTVDRSKIGVFSKPKYYQFDKPQQPNEIFKIDNPLNLLEIKLKTHDITTQGTNTLSDLEEDIEYRNTKSKQKQVEEMERDTKELRSTLSKIEKSKRKREVLEREALEKSKKSKSSRSTKTRKPKSKSETGEIINPGKIANQRVQMKNVPWTLSEMQTLAKALVAHGTSWIEIKNGYFADSFRTYGQIRDRTRTVGGREACIKKYLTKEQRIKLEQQKKVKKDNTDDTSDDDESSSDHQDESDRLDSEDDFDQQSEDDFDSHSHSHTDESEDENQESSVVLTEESEEEKEKGKHQQKKKPSRVSGTKVNGKSDKDKHDSSDESDDSQEELIDTDPDTDSKQPKKKSKTSDTPSSSSNVSKTDSKSRSVATPVKSKTTTTSSSQPTKKPIKKTTTTSSSQPTTSSRKTISSSSEDESESQSDDESDESEDEIALPPPRPSKKTAKKKMASKLPSTKKQQKEEEEEKESSIDKDIDKESSIDLDKDETISSKDNLKVYNIGDKEDQEMIIDEIDDKQQHDDLDPPSPIKSSILKNK